MYLSVNESHPLNPRDVNGINKMAAEKYHLLYTEIYGIHAAATRFDEYNRPADAHTGCAADIRGMDSQIARAPASRALGRETATRLYGLEDTVDALLAVAPSPASKGEVYNLGGQRNDRFSRLGAIDGGREWRRGISRLPFSAGTGGN